MDDTDKTSSAININAICETFETLSKLKVDVPTPYRKRNRFTPSNLIRLKKNVNKIADLIRNYDGDATKNSYVI